MWTRVQGGPYPPLIERGEAGTRATAVVLVCEHASNAIPPEFGDLGLDAEARRSHIAWDPGALEVARDMRRQLSADLVAASVSRLLYDCNRPPEAASAMPEAAEIYEIPGNRGLDAAARAARTDVIYVPFRAALAGILDERGTGILVTVHSFTPVFHGVRRTCEIGVLHDADTRLADAVLAAVPPDFPVKLERNVPYAAADGVTHTLKEHAVARGWPNIMLEIRNDLIETPAQQAAMAGHLVTLLRAAVPQLKAPHHA
jgi:predicted N-formylglutamate amidohydrolase